MFIPRGNTQDVAVGDIPGLLALTAGTHVRIVSVQDRSGYDMWTIRFATGVASAVDGARYIPGTVATPLFIAIPSGADHMAMLGFNADEHILVTCGDWVPDEPFDPVGACTSIMVSPADQRIALPAGTKRIRLTTDLNYAGGDLYIKFGDSTVAGAWLDTMMVRPPTLYNPWTVGVPAGATHMSIFCAQQYGGEIMMDTGIASPSASGASGTAGMTLIQTIAAAGSPIDIALPSIYKGIRIIGRALSPSVDAVNLDAQFMQDGSAISAASSYMWDMINVSGSVGSVTNNDSVADTRIPMHNPSSIAQLSNVAGDFLDFDMEIWNHGLTGNRKTLRSLYNYLDETPRQQAGRIDGILLANTNAVDGIRLFVTSGIITGPIHVFGYA